MKKFGYIILALIALFIILSDNSKADVVIPNESIRFRVIANSNLPVDQMIKGKVKNQLEETIVNILENAKNLDEARTLLKNNLSLLDNVVKQTLISLDLESDDYSIDYGYHLFPEKTYQNHQYQEGYYESLVVTLGEGKGNNWWCVLFPPLCFMDKEGFDEGKSEKIEYTSFFKKLWDNITK